MATGVSKSTVTTIVRLSKIIEILLAEMGLTTNQFRLLSLVDEGATSSAEIGVRLAMKAPNVTTMTNNLIERGWLAREQDSDDRRRAHLKLTGDGEAIVTSADERCRNALLHVIDLTGSKPNLLDQIDAWLPVLEATAADLRFSLTREQNS